MLDRTSAILSLNISLQFSEESDSAASPSDRQTLPFAEAHARFKQYEYRANSSLVLTTDSRPRDTHKPTRELESLHGKIDPKTFDEYRGRPPE
ncbi:unnamed protein product [Camellia sinensis]